MPSEDICDMVSSLDSVCCILNIVGARTIGPFGTKPAGMFCVVSWLITIHCSHLSESCENTKSLRRGQLATMYLKLAHKLSENKTIVSTAVMPKVTCVSGPLESIPPHSMTFCRRFFWSELANLALFTYDEKVAGKRFIDIAGP